MEGWLAFELGISIVVLVLAAMALAKYLSK